MQYRSLDDDGSNYLIVLQAGEEVVESLRTFASTEAKGHEVTFTGIGAVSSAHLLAFDQHTGQYTASGEIDDQAEIASLIGNIGEYQGRPIVHAHAVLGRLDGTAVAGHVKDLTIRPTCEITARVHDHEAEKRFSQEWDAPLYDLE